MSKTEDFEFPYCRDQATSYEKITKVGQGTFGQVQNFCLCDLDILWLILLYQCSFRAFPDVAQ